MFNRFLIINKFQIPTLDTKTKFEREKKPPEIILQAHVTFFESPIQSDHSDSSAHINYYLLLQHKYFFLSLI